MRITVRTFDDFSLSACPHLHALKKQSHDVTTGNKSVYVASQSLRQAAEKIQSHDHEILVRRFVLVWLLTVHLTRTKTSWKVLEVIISEDVKVSSPL